jgi:hypothetical protein
MYLRFITPAIVLLIVGFLLAVGGGRAKSWGDTNVFRYKAERLKLLLFCSPLPVFTVTFIYVVTPRPSDTFALACVLLGLIPMGLIIYLYRYFKAFSMELDIDIIRVVGLRGERLIKYADIGEVIFAQGGQGAFVLSLVGHSGKEIIRLSDSIEGLQDIASFVKEKVVNAGGTYRYIDRWGKGSS